MLKQNAGQAMSILASYDVSDNVVVYANHNVVDFNSTLLQLYAPRRNRTFDNNLGIQVRFHDSPITLRFEYHNIRGTGWFSVKQNPLQHNATHITAAQLVYSF
jgi:hypothetical protein